VHKEKGEVSEGDCILFVHLLPIGALAALLVKTPKLKYGSAGENFESGHELFEICCVQVQLTT
jgi:hypothetical protein